MSRTKMIVPGCLVALVVSAAAATTAGATRWSIGVGCENDPTNKGHFLGQVSAFCVLFHFTAVYKYKYKFVNGASGVSVSTVSTQVFTDEGAGTSVSCRVAGEGTIGPEAADKITKLTATECKTVKGECGSPTVAAMHLPWSTEVYEPVSEEFRDKIKSSGAGNPGWKVTCVIAGIFKVTDECEGETSTQADNGEGDVEEVFDAKSAKAHCSVGGSATGVIEGTTDIGPLSSEEAVFLE